PGNGKCVSDNGLSPQANPATGTTVDGPSWASANGPNGPDALEKINSSLQLTLEGSGPYASSRHPSGVNVVMCDGSARFISDTINGTVWAKMITPRGSQLPCDLVNGTGCYRQLPLGQDEALGQ